MNSKNLLYLKLGFNLSVVCKHRFSEFVFFKKKENKEKMKTEKLRAQKQVLCKLCECALLLDSDIITFRQC